MHIMMLINISFFLSFFFFNQIIEMRVHMDCAGCQSKVKSKLEKLKGIQKITGIILSDIVISNIIAYYTIN